MLLGFYDSWHRQYGSYKHCPFGLQRGPWLNDVFCKAAVREMNRAICVAPESPAAAAATMSLMSYARIINSSRSPKMADFSVILSLASSDGSCSFQQIASLEAYGSPPSHCEAAARSGP